MADETTTEGMQSQNETAQPDLEKLRDDKCFPVAHTIMKQMCEDLLNVKDGQKELTKKFLSLMLAQDMNVTEEAGYVPQLILGALSGLNSVVQGCTVIENDDERYARIGSKILTILSNAQVNLAPTKEEIPEVFEPLKVELNTLFAEENVTRLEVKHIMDSIFDAFTELNNLTNKSITDATERMECKILGIEFMSDLTLSKVNDTLIG